MIEEFLDSLERKFTTVNRIAVVSDSALGFGSPDINALCDGLCKRFNAKGLLIQPDDINRPIVNLRFEADVTSKRMFSILPTYTRSWRWHFFRMAGAALDSFRPDVVVCVGPNGYGGVRAMKHKPRLLVYYMLEMVTNEELFAQLHHAGGNADIDCYIIPDIARHDIDFTELKWKKDVLMERILLTAPINYPDPMVPCAADARNGKLIYFGSIHPEDTLLDSQLNPDLDDIPIEFFGRISGSNRHEVANRIAGTPNKVYGGLLMPDQLAVSLPQYCYSLVTWKPVGSIARYHLPATKLYHSVISGVPVIAVPNPLNSYWIKRLGCGVLLDGWNRSALTEGIRKAVAMIGTDAYRTMVDNCRVAAETEFRWDVQVQRSADMIELALKRKFAQRYAPRRLAALG